MIEYNNKNILNSYHLLIENKNLENKNLENKNLENKNLENRNNKYNINDTYSSIYVFIHYGIFCLKRLALFFTNKVIIQGIIYSLDNAIYNDNLYEITIPSKIIIRIEFNSIYDYIKSLSNKNRLAIYYNNLI